MTKNEVKVERGASLVVARAQPMGTYHPTDLKAKAVVNPEHDSLNHLSQLKTNDANRSTTNPNAKLNQPLKTLAAPNAREAPRNSTDVNAHRNLHLRHPRPYPPQFE
jgi:hypothetical protein